MAPRGARRIRLWHFVVLPALAMGLILLLVRVLDAVVVPGLGPEARDAYRVVRTLCIALSMTSIVGWLAVRYRGQYEDELRERNRAVEEARDFLAGIIEGSGEAILSLDASDRVTSWNRAAEAIFGWPASEMIGHGFDRLLPDDPAFREERRSVGAELRAGRTVRDRETVRLRRDGRRIVVRITWSPRLDTHGHYAGAIAIVLDVTTEAEMRRRLVERERLAAVGELAAQVAHEVRNPLAGIRGACEVMFGKAGQSLDREEIRHEVLRQIDRLNRSVEDLLRFADPRPLHRVPADLHERIERVVTLLGEDPRSSGVTVVRHYAPGMPALTMDPAQIDQVFYNLLVNAAQMMAYHGTITIRTAIEDGAACVTVHDTGPGIAPGMTEKIFSPFVSTRAEGTGLGLAIVRKILGAHGGTIEAASSEGGGAEFRMRLPMSEETLLSAKK